MLPLFFPGLDPRLAAQSDLILSNVRALLDAGSDANVRRLRGRKIGLMCAIDTPSATLMRRAVEGLGAQIAFIGPMWMTPTSSDSIRRTAEASGKLYDAVECEGMPAALLDEFERHCDVPVFDGLAADGHPTAALVGLIEAPRRSAERRLLIVQGVLLAVLS